MCVCRCRSDLSFTVLSSRSSARDRPALADYVNRVGHRGTNARVTTWRHQIDRPGLSNRLSGHDTVIGNPHSHTLSLVWLSCVSSRCGAVRSRACAIDARSPSTRLWTATRCTGWEVIWLKWPSEWLACLGNGCGITSLRLRRNCFTRILIGVRRHSWVDRNVNMRCSFPGYIEIRSRATKKWVRRFGKSIFFFNKSFQWNDNYYCMKLRHTSHSLAVRLDLKSSDRLLNYSFVWFCGGLHQYIGLVKGGPGGHAPNF